MELLKRKILLKFPSSTKNPIMKKVVLIPFAAIIGLLFLHGTPEPKAVPHYLDYELPANVKAVVDQKCYGCHNVESKNEKGKAKLDWDALVQAKKSKRLATMDKISEVLEKGEMPPQKFLEMKPEAKLSESDLATLKEWSAGKTKSAKK
jgi:mono/diheme cytochrome c family protein